MILKRTLFLAHADADGPFAEALAEFLEFGCEVRCTVEGASIPAGGDLVAKAEEGLGFDVLVLILSRASCPKRWKREVWEPVLFTHAREAKVNLITILLADCPFPELLRRGKFIDARGDTLGAMRLLKRWIWRSQGVRAAPSDDRVSPELAELYAALADRGGTARAGSEAAIVFAREAGDQFETVLWIPCHGRTLAQIAGDLMTELGLVADRTAEQNCGRIREILQARRCLLILDAPAADTAGCLMVEGRSSILITERPVQHRESPESLEYARILLSGRRYAEAYELLYRLMHAGIDRENCARELTWICEHWDRIDEANALRFQYRPPAAEQLRLF